MVSASEVDRLLEQCQPLSALELLGEDVPEELMIYKAQALMYVDQGEEAAKCLEPVIPHLGGDQLAQGKRLWAQLLMAKSRVDESILTAQEAGLAAVSTAMRVRTLTLLADAYCYKACFQMAESTLKDAMLLVGPQEPNMLLTRGAIKEHMDERLQARELYMQLANSDAPWAGFYSAMRGSTVALLLGDFEETRCLAERAIEFSNQYPYPYYVLAHLAEINDDPEKLEAIVEQVRQRFPKAETLPTMDHVLQRLKAQRAAPDGSRRRLQAFPTTIQKRDYCGPSTMDLLFRFWSAEEVLTDDQIAAYVKLPHGGTPLYRMREFFHLVGFDTIRCRASLENLKRLVNAGFPAIVTAWFSEAAHVSVVIGYDESAHTVEFQDPATHAVLSIPEDAVSHVRKLFMNSAVLAFPHGKGYEKKLAELGFFDELPIVWTDQADLDMENGRFGDAAALMERAIQSLPDHELSWILLLGALYEQWKQAIHDVPGSLPRLAPRRRQAASRAAKARKHFHEMLAHARQRFPLSRRILCQAARAALLDGKPAEALAAFKRATEIEKGDSRSFAGLAETYFGLRQVDQALEAAREAVQRNPAEAAPNAWMARCLAAKGKQEAEHYARCALELAPRWSVAHLAMADVLRQKNDYPGAERELAIARELEPHDPELEIAHAMLLFEHVDQWSSVDDLRRALASTWPIPLDARYSATQALCKIMWTRREFARAARTARKLLERLPDDPWLLQFVAAATAEDKLRRRRFGERSARLEVWKLFKRAIEVDPEKTWLVREYIEYRAQAEGPQSALTEIQRLREAYPETMGLRAVQAQHLKQSGKPKEAAELMLQALNCPGETPTPDSLQWAVETILRGYEAQEGEKAILQEPFPEGTASLSQRQRAVGLELGLDGEKHGQRARELLEAAVQTDAEDALATLRLADVLENAERREQLYHRAVRLAPLWLQARDRLAGYLIDHDRPAEALQLVYGYQHESANVAITLGRALYTLGRYDEAAEACSVALAQFPTPPAWLYDNLWLIHTRNGDHAAALAAARSALRSAPREPWRHLRAATSLRSMGRNWEADWEIERARFEGLEWDGVLRARFEKAWDEGRYATALEIVNQQIKRQPNAGGKQFGELDACRMRLLLELKRFKEAQALVEEKSPDTAEAWDGVLQASTGAAVWDLAAEYARRCLALDPQHYDALLCQAAALVETGRLEEGEQAIEALRAMKPHEHYAYEWLAELRGAQDRLDEALQLAERGVLLGESCPFSWAVRGSIYFLKGEWELARLDLETAWRRADADNRRHGQSYWWILRSLQYKPLEAAACHRKALAEVQAEWHVERLSKIRDHLRKTAGARWRQHPLLAGLVRSIRRLEQVLHVRQQPAALQGADVASREASTEVVEAREASSKDSA